MLNSHWGRAATGKKKSCAYAHRVASVVSNSLRPCRLAYLEKEMATHSSILAWRIPGTEEPSGLLLLHLELTQLDVCVVLYVPIHWL